MHARTHAHGVMGKAGWLTRPIRMHACQRCAGGSFGRDAPSGVASNNTWRNPTRGVLAHGPLYLREGNGKGKKQAN